MPDCLLERGGFEPPRPVRIGGAEFNPSLARYPTPNKSIRAGENLFRVGFGSSSETLRFLRSLG